MAGAAEVRQKPVSPALSVLTTTFPHPQFNHSAGFSDQVISGADVTSAQLSNTHIFSKQSAMIFQFTYVVRYNHHSMINTDVNYVPAICVNLILFIVNFYSSVIITTHQISKSVLYGAIE
ncbi:hypothetical protein [Photorhabdus sp. RM323S]|uniref:hypothetical protein n=1 Tax=Photorhabdus sp. RM323S TaxID=3342828 RepID=UPI0036D9CCCF